MTEEHRVAGPETNTRDATLDEQPLVRPGRSLIATIGIDAYQHWPRLACAVSDARGAREQFLCLGFEDAVPPLYNEAATRDAIHALVTDDLRALTEDDRLVVFYAGHGGTRTERPAGEEIKTGYLVPVDAALQRDNVATWIELESWLRRVSLLSPRHILVILDSCHSGIALNAAYRWRDNGLPSSAPLATLEARRSRRVITSALDHELALDSGPVEGHSLFTGCLIEALQGAAPRVGRVTTGSALGLWVQGRVRSYPGVRQTPDFGAFDRDDRGELVIPVGSERAAAVAATGSADAARSDSRATTPDRRPAVARRALPSPWFASLRRWRHLWAVAAIVFWILFLIGSVLR